MSHHGTREGNDRNRRAECGWCWHPALISWLLSQNGEGGLLPTPALCLKLFFFFLLAMETPLAPAHGKLEVLEWEGVAWTQPWVLNKGQKGENWIGGSFPLLPMCLAARPELPSRLLLKMALASPPSLLTSPLYNCYFLGPSSPLTLNFPCLNPCLAVCF